MIALKIEDRKQFTSKLFLGETFHSFLLREANIITFNSFAIDGHIKQGYYTAQELEENRVGELSSWKMLQPICFELIKGKRLPGSFRIAMQVSSEAIKRFLLTTGIAVTPEEVGGLYLNIRYEEGNLSCITGTSLNYFTLDKSLDFEWDKAVRQFLKKSEIAFTEEA